LVLGADNLGEHALTYTWSTSYSVSFGAANGTNASKTMPVSFSGPGSYPFTVTITDGEGASTTSTVTVTVNQTATTAVVTPELKLVPPNTVIPYQVSVLNQWGQTMYGLTPAWTVSGGGTINATSGSFTAGTTVGGPHTVTATVGGLTATALVTVTGKPTVTTTAAASITGTGATLGGNVTNEGGFPVTSRGICWATTANPVVTGNKIEVGAGAGSYTSPVTGLTPGVTYYVRAFASNSAGISYGSQVTFQATANPPTVALTSPAPNTAVVAPGSFTLTATASDSDGTISKVEFFNGATLLNTDTAAPYTFTWSGVAAGSYSITAKATDNHNASTTSTAVPVVVTNGFPTVSLTSPTAGQVFGAPGTIVLTANAVDVGGSISKVEFFNGATLLNTDTAAPFTFTWTNVPVGSYSLTAKATDGSTNATTSTAVAVAVATNVAPTVSLTAPLTGTGFAAPATVTLTATAADTDGTISKVEFFNGATLIGTDTSSPYSFTWSNVATGTYSVTAKATDNSGGATTSTASSISVFTNSPTVSLTSPAANAIFSAPGSITLSATATDDGTIAKVEFYNGTTLLNTDTSAPYSYAWTNVAAGSYNLTAKATDNVGGYTTSAVIPVIVNALPTVSLTAPTGGSSVPTGQAITLTATASDSDGITQVEFLDGPTVLATDTTSPYSYVWNGAAKGSRNLTARATDSRGGVKTSSAVTITVTNRAPTVALTSPADNAVVAPGTVALAATASDPDGTVSKVEFFLGSTKLGEDLSLPYTFSWTGATAGLHPLMVQATDDSGAVTSSAYTQVKVGTNTAPTADFSITNAPSPNHRTVSFDSSLSSDPEGDALTTYAWTFTNQAAGEPNASNDPKPTITFNAGATNFTVTLRVTDAWGAQSTVVSRTYDFANLAGGTLPGEQENSDKKIIHVGETTFFSVSMDGNMASSATWTQSGKGQVVFKESDCDWRTSLNRSWSSGACSDGVEVKGTQPGKVKISFASTPHSENNCGGGSPGSGNPPGSPVYKDFEVTVLPRPEPPPKMPLGSKYRRVDVHGIPMPDPSPTGEGEQDRVPNMAYTDMFGLTPTYATTDVSIPVDGGELTLEFRRTMSIKSRNYNTDAKRLGITYPTEDLLGLGWDTNLGSRVIITTRKDKAGNNYLVADVTDETGGSYSYVISGSTFLADLAHSFNNEAIKARLAYDTDPANPQGLVLTKPHGTKVIYEPVRRGGNVVVFYAPFSSASGGGCGETSLDLHKEVYHRVKAIVDRNGNRLNFTYHTHRAPEYETVNGRSQPKAAPAGEGPNGDLVPKTVTFVNNGFTADNKRILTITAKWHTEYAENAWLHIATGRDSGWRIDSVSDPLGRVTNYIYTPQTAPIDPWIGAVPKSLFGLLQEVRRPGVTDFVESTGAGVNDGATAVQSPTVRFTYAIRDLTDVLMDPVNPPQMDGNVGINRFVAPATITDARGHVTTMTYQADWFPVNYYPTVGSFVWQNRIRLKTMGTAADGTATFNMAAYPNAYVINAGAGTIDLTTDVTDVRGVKTTFKFSQKLVLVPNEIGAALYVTKFVRATAGSLGTGNTGQTVFEFSDPFGLPDPNGNLTKVTDMSGNVIQFVYRSGAVGDTFDQGLTLPANPLNGYYNPNGYMVFNKPAKRIVDPGGLNLVTEYRYDKTRFNKQSEEIDAEGKRTVYLFDTRGNRTEVQEAVGTPVARTTKYAYGANGFVTQVTDPDARVTTHVLTFPTSVLAKPTGMTLPGEPAYNVFDTYRQVVSTVKGYNNELTLATTTVSDVMGLDRWVTDPRGNSTRMYYDALNRTTTVLKPAVVKGDGTSGTSISETFYDLNGNVRKQTDDEGNATVTTYDAMNRPTKVRVRMTNGAQNTDTTDLITQTNYRHGSDTGAASVGLPRFTLDAMNNRTDYEYDNLLRVTTTTFPTVTLPGGSTTRYTTVNTYGKNSGSGAFAYWSGWQPVRVKDKRGFFTDTNYDKIYRPTRVVQRSTTSPPSDPYTAPASGEPTTETFYTKTHKPVRQVTWTENWANSASNQTTWTTYDSLYRVSAVVVDGNNGNGTVTAVTAPATFTEDGIAYAATVTNANALVTATRYVFGTLSTPAQTIAQDALGRQTTSTFDGAGRLTQVVQPTVRVIDPKNYNPNDTDVAPTTKYTYDANGNRTITEDANKTKTQTTYDARNRPTQVIVDLDNDGVYRTATFTGTPAGNADLVTSTRYNLVDKPVKVTNSRGYATDTVYDKAYRVLTVTQPQVTNAQASPATTVSPVITRTYDKNGNLLTIQDARQKVHTPTIMTVNTYDELNRLRTTTEASGGNATTEVLKTETQYDPNGNVLALLCFNSAGSGGTQTTSYTYDAYNRKLTETLPTVADALLRRTTWTYYRNSAVRTATDAKSQVHEQEYDRAGRLTRSRHKLSGGTTDETRTLTYSKTGKLLTIADKTGTTTNTYDALDRVATETRATTGQTAYAVQNGYDAIGQRTRVIYPVTNRTTLNSFDRGGRLVLTGDSKGTRETKYAYDTVGNRLMITEPAPNSVVTTNTYDALDRCTRSWTRKGTTPVSDYDYAFDLVGNRLTVTENIALQGSRVITYVYDARYQLLSEAWTGYSASYTYDLAGNRLTKVVGATTVTSEYDALNRLMKTTATGGVVTNFAYDLNGNQTSQQIVSGTTHTFTWDVHNRLVNVTDTTNTLAATYDYRTRRETTNVNGAGARFFRYDQGVSFHELVANALQVEFLRGPELGGGIGSILSSDRTMAGGTEETFAYNPAVGHVTALTDINGATVDSDRYDAFGNIVGTPVGSSLNNRLANTKERNAIGTLVLDNHGFRYYNPVTGRYLNRDPKGYPDGLNNYLYCGNNPINRIDPFGLDDEEPGYNQSGSWWYRFANRVGESVSAIHNAMRVGAAKMGVGEATYDADLQRKANPMQRSAQEHQPGWVEPVTTGAVVVGAAAATTAAVVIVVEAAGPVVRAATAGSTATEDAEDGAPDPGQPPETDQDPNPPTTKEVKTRQKPGGDGGQSTVTVERDQNGDEVSKKHTVTKDGEVVHQHQDHRGKAGSVRRFPDEWTGTDTVNAPPEDKSPSFPPEPSKEDPNRGNR
jgi:RHS repeat-associated protein